MLNLLLKDYGEYVKGFFVIRLGLKLKEGISLDNLNQEQFATFVHEYIHFLQNITTTHGVTYFNDNSKLIQLYVSESYKYKKKIPYPLQIEECGVENVYEEMELRSFYLGDSGQKRIHHINDIKIEKDEIIELTIQDEELQSVNIYYDDKENPYVFGTTCIEESIAYLIESEKFEGLPRVNELPYNSCELVCKKLCPDLENRKEIIVALAELSLMHYHSGKMFVELLGYISKEKNFKDTNEVVLYFKDRIPHLFKDYEEAYKETEETINFLYPLGTPFEPINTWLKMEMMNGFECRKKYYNLLSRIMDLSVDSSRAYFSKLVSIFNYPAICDENDEIYCGEYELGLALVPIAIFNEFKGEETKCYLYQYCKKGKIPTFNNNCCISPWCQSEEDVLCPFGSFWYHYSLSGKIIDKWV